MAHDSREQRQQRLCLRAGHRRIYAQAQVPHREEERLRPGLHPPARTLSRDEFTVEAPLLPEFYASLLYFLTQPGSFYLEFDHAGARKQFPVTIDSLPKCADDLHEYRDAVKFTLESRYTGTPTAINFDIVIPQEDDDTTITTG